MPWTDHPIVSLSRGEQSFELGRGPSQPVLLRHGSTGLGLAPISIASSDRLGGHGTVVRGVRYGPRDIFLPIRLSASNAGELTAKRRELYRLLAPHLGPVNVRIQDPATGTDRTIKGLLKDGLNGDFGAGFYGTWQTLGLTFECHDPWWMGAEHTSTFRVTPGVKPFISNTVDFFPVVLAQSTVQGRFEVDIAGDGEAYPVWEITGPGEDLIISDGVSEVRMNGIFRPGEVVRIDTREGRITPDRWANVPVESRLFSLHPGRTVLTVTMVGASIDTTVALTYRERYLEAI